MSSLPSSLPRCVSRKPDPLEALLELRDHLLPPGSDPASLDTVMLFASSRYEPVALAAAINTVFGSIPVIGCTTSGEIAPDGYCAGSLVAVGFPRGEFCVVAERIESVDRFSVGDSSRVLRSLLARRDRALAGRGFARLDRASFAILLIDGLAMREELVVSALHNLLVDVPLFGGSAGDDLSFERTMLFHNGGVHANAALIILVYTTRRFSVFRTEHFVSSERKMVVTGADPIRRIVTEINAEPAAREYARMVGLEGKPLTPMIFASHPVVVRVGGQYHVRSIQKVNPDESLTFFCAIDEGIVLTVAEGMDIVENFEALMTRLAADVGSIDMVLGFDCILRRLEMEQRHLIRIMSQAAMRHHVVGFCAYGEQYQGMHLNQTFTGVAIGTSWR